MGAPGRSPGRSPDGVPTGVPNGSLSQGWGFVLLVFAASRLFFLGAGALAAALLPQAEPGGDPLEPPGFLNYWAHWDGAWYSFIATEGYEPRAPESHAFFPLYPLLIRAGVVLFGGPALWGVAVSLLATLFTLYFVYRIAERLWDERAARASVIALAVFPTAFFLNAVYTEALFLALSTGAVWAAMVRRSLALAGVFGLLAALTRNTGVFLVLPLLWEWWRGRPEFGWSGLPAAGLPTLGLAGYMAFAYDRTGDPLAFATQQGEYWGRELTSPVSVVRDAVAEARESAGFFTDLESLNLLFTGSSAGPAFAFSHLHGFFLLGVAVGLLAAGVFLLPPGLWLYSFVVFAPPVISPSPSLPLMGLPRFILGAFPLFLVLGYLLSRSRPALGVYVLFGLVSGLGYTALFVTWRWVA